MLVTFTGKAHADITMFGDVAQRLLRLMGHSGTVPGALLAEDVPAALERLKSAVETEKAAPAAERSRDGQDEDANENAVSLRHRALPLIELLTAAVHENCNVMWD